MKEVLADIGTAPSAKRFMDDQAQAHQFKELRAKSLAIESYRSQTARAVLVETLLTTTIPRKVRWLAQALCY